MRQFTKQRYFQTFSIYAGATKNIKQATYNLTGCSKLHICCNEWNKHLRMPHIFINCCYLTTELTNEKQYRENEGNKMQVDRNSVITINKGGDTEIDDQGEHWIEKLEGKSNMDILQSDAIDPYEDVSYYVENGLRKVFPYYFTYRTFVKERWVGRKLLDILKNEFRTTSAEEYVWNFKSGAVTVNNEKVDMDYKVKLQDYIQNTVHRHEAPVIYQPIPIIHLDKDILVINKPPSIPVHPNGMYRYNSALFILSKEYGLKNVRCVHRLDRLTSGLLIFGRTKEIAQTLAYQIRNREVEKEYICRVVGEFPEKVIECREPIEVSDSRIAIGRVSANGKPCVTVFHKLSYNGKSSVVLCKPTTGRMHQIRIHLQFLGYPILNDTLYNNHTNMGETNELLNVALEIYSAEDHCKTHTDNISQLQNYKSSQVAFTVDEYCSECKMIAATDPNFSDLIIYLHAWKYKGKGWMYKTKLPDWTQEKWPYM